MEAGTNRVPPKMDFGSFSLLDMGPGMDDKEFDQHAGISSPYDTEHDRFGVGITPAEQHQPSDSSSTSSLLLQDLGSDASSAPLLHQPDRDTPTPSQALTGEAFEREKVGTSPPTTSKKNLCPGSVLDGNMSNTKAGMNNFLVEQYDGSSAGATAHSDAEGNTSADDRTIGEKASNERDEGVEDDSRCEYNHDLMVNVYNEAMAKFNADIEHMKKVHIEKMSSAARAAVLELDNWKVRVQTHSKRQLEDLAEIDAQRHRKRPLLAQAAQHVRRLLRSFGV